MTGDGRQRLQTSVEGQLLGCTVGQTWAHPPIGCNARQAVRLYALHPGRVENNIEEKLLVKTPAK